MTVQRLIERLQLMDPDAVVVFPDTWWESEGYGEHAHDFDYLHSVVDDVTEREGHVILLPE